MRITGDYFVLDGETAITYRDRIVMPGRLTLTNRNQTRTIRIEYSYGNIGESSCRTGNDLLALRSATGDPKTSVIPPAALEKLLRDLVGS